MQWGCSMPPSRISKHSTDLVLTVRRPACGAGPVKRDCVDHFTQTADAGNSFPAAFCLTTAGPGRQLAQPLS